MIDTLADPALRGLEGRERGSTCTTSCRAGCPSTCHERCRKPGARPLHDQFYCDQIRIGRDVTEYRPDIRQAWDAEVMAARMAGEEGRVRPALRRSSSGDLFGDGHGFTAPRRRDRLISGLMRRLSG